VRQRRHHHIKPDLHLSGDQIGHHGRAAAIGDVDHVDPGHHLEQLARQVRRCSGPERGHGDLARTGLGIGDQLRNGFRRDRRIGHKHHGKRDQPGNRHDVAQHVERQIV